MTKVKGRHIPLSPARKIVWDVLESSRNIPLISVYRQMNVRELMQARAAAQPRPSWNSIFTKAYAKVAAEVPELRQLFIRWPWGRLYEHPRNRALIAVESDMDHEKVIVGAHVAQPELMDVVSLDQYVAGIKHDSGRSKAYRRNLLLARLPRPLRRLLWWLGLEWSGPRRARCLGTFGVTSVSHAGAELGSIVTATAHVLHYGLVDAAGNVRVMVVFDHRIMDAALPSRALVRMEHFLKTDLLNEVLGLQARAAA
jgi:hypothetical protein